MSLLSSMPSALSMEAFRPHVVSRTSNTEAAADEGYGGDDDIDRATSVATAALATMNRRPSTNRIDVTGDGDVERGMQLGRAAPADRSLGLHVLGDASLSLEKRGNDISTTEKKMPSVATKTIDDSSFAYNTEVGESAIALLSLRRHASSGKENVEPNCSFSRGRRRLPLEASPIVKKKVRNSDKQCTFHECEEERIVSAEKQCPSCRMEKSQSKFPRRQWNRERGKGWCIECIGDGASVERGCMVCHDKIHPMDRLIASQGQQTTNRKCMNCEIVRKDDMSEGAQKELRLRQSAADGQGAAAAKASNNGGTSPSSSSDPAVTEALPASERSREAQSPTQSPSHSQGSTEGGDMMEIPDGEGGEATGAASRVPESKVNRVKPSAMMEAQDELSEHADKALAKLQWEADVKEKSVLVSHSDVVEKDSFLYVLAMMEAEGNDTGHRAWGSVPQAITTNENETSALSIKASCHREKTVDGSNSHQGNDAVNSVTSTFDCDVQMQFLDGDRIEKTSSNQCQLDPNASRDATASGNAEVITRKCNRCNVHNSLSKLQCSCRAWKGGKTGSAVESAEGCKLTTRDRPSFEECPSANTASSKSAVDHKSARSKRAETTMQRRNTISTEKCIRNRSRCGNCAECLLDDCQECASCLDMRKYGGPGRLKKRCENRKVCSLKRRKAPLSNLQLYEGVYEATRGTSVLEYDVQKEGKSATSSPIEQESCHEAKAAKSSAAAPLTAKGLTVTIPSASVVVAADRPTPEAGGAMSAGRRAGERTGPASVATSAAAVDVTTVNWYDMYNDTDKPLPDSMPFPKRGGFVSLMFDLHVVPLLRDAGWTCSKTFRGATRNGGREQNDDSARAKIRRSHCDYEFVPPNVKPAAPFVKRKDYFDSLKQLMEYLKSDRCENDNAGRYANLFVDEAARVVAEEWDRKNNVAEAKRRRDKRRKMEKKGTPTTNRLAADNETAAEADSNDEESTNDAAKRLITVAQEAVLSSMVSNSIGKGGSAAPKAATSGNAGAKKRKRPSSPVPPTAVTRQLSSDSAAGGSKRGTATRDKVKLQETKKTLPGCNNNDKKSLLFPSKEMAEQEIVAPILRHHGRDGTDEEKPFQVSNSQKEPDNVELTVKGEEALVQTVENRAVVHDPDARVYACWIERGHDHSGLWYPGTVVRHRIAKKGRQRGNRLYHIRFDDGDEATGLEEHFVMDHQEYLALTSKPCGLEERELTGSFGQRLPNRKRKMSSLQSEDPLWEKDEKRQPNDGRFTIVTGLKASSAKVSAASADAVSVLPRCAPAASFAPADAPASAAPAAAKHPDSDISPQWLERLEELREYMAMNGGVLPSEKEKSVLYNFARNQRAAYQRKHLSAVKIRLLEAIGFTWRGPKKPRKTSLTTSLSIPLAVSVPADLEGAPTPGGAGAASEPAGAAPLDSAADNAQLAPNSANGRTVGLAGSAPGGATFTGLEDFEI